MDIREEKAALRRAVGERAKALTPEYRRQANAAICRNLLALEELERAGTVFSFVPMAREPDVRPVLKALLDRGRTLAAPRCLSKGVMEARRVERLSQLHTGFYGISEPGEDLPPVPWDRVDFAVVPCVAADRLGGRLGRGGGYYDRFLSAVPGLPAAAVCYAALMPDRVPAEAHDVPIPLVVTEEGVWRGGRLLDLGR